MSLMPARRRLRDWLSRDHLYISAPALILTIVAFVVAWSFMKPAPPRRLVIATGPPDGVYYQMGLRYNKLLAHEGITLDVRSTSGSVENVRLLEDSDRGVDVAFVQGGVLTARPSSDVLALGSLYLEPVWMFTRATIQGHDLNRLNGKRLAIGPEGSGTRALAELLLGANRVTSASAQLLPLTGLDAVRALERGTADAMFLVAAPEARAVREAIRGRGVTLVSFSRADAYTRLFSFLRKVVLPEGALDLAADLPAKDTVLMAAAVNLVIRRDLHPALSNLLLIAASTVHSPGGLFEQPRQFPSPDGVDVPLSDEARHYYQAGPPFLIRYLPFWAATLVDRLKIMLVPLIAVLFPLIKIAPSVYQWRVRSKIYRWYDDLDAVDLALREKLSPGQTATLRQELDRIEREVRLVEVPASYREEHYHLRLHLEYLRAKVADAEGDPRSTGDI
jgi:TRAP transporter TAXI family solute receptor